MTLGIFLALVINVWFARKLLEEDWFVEPLEAGRTLLRMSMPVDPGNSGGPLFNRRGEVVGVVSQKRSERNIAYAVPIEKINDFAY